MIDSISWLALATLTETDIPSEWPVIMQIINNRARHRGLSVFEVVTEPWQFSAFNGWAHLTDSDRAKAEQEIFHRATLIKNATDRQSASSKLCALAMLGLPPECGILAPTVELYWSPRSMVPAYSLPKWDWSKVRCFTFPGIAAERFVFGEEVKAGTVGAGNVHLVAPTSAGKPTA